MLADFLLGLNNGDEKVDREVRDDFPTVPVLWQSLSPTVT